MHYTLEAWEDDCLQNHTVHVSIRVCRPFTKGGCAHGIRGEGELCSTYSLDKCFATCLTWWRRRISITQVHECLMQTSGGQGTAGGQGEGGPARGCGWILLRGWTKDALNLAKSGCKVAVNSR